MVLNIYTPPIYVDITYIIISNPTDTLCKLLWYKIYSPVYGMCRFMAMRVVTKQIQIIPDGRYQTETIQYPKIQQL